jgi:Arc/MetJ family transcription regulator
MRTTLRLEDEMLARAKELTGLKERSRLIRKAWKALIARESGRRLARLGGSEPDIEAAPRRRLEGGGSSSMRPSGSVICALTIQTSLA